MRADELAAAVVDSMRSALAPVTTRIDTIESQMAERLKAAATENELTIAREMTAIRERLAAIEARPPVPGPPGADGQPGPPGRDGRDGDAGTPGLKYCGVYQAGATYERGDIVTYGGSAWHCDGPTNSNRPGDGVTGWVLMVKRGRDGRGA